jgi:hypothetical protein
MSAKKFVYDEDLKFQSGLVVATRIVTADTTLTNTSGPRGSQTASDGLDGGYDYLLAIDTNSSITVTLPTTETHGATVGRVYYITDYVGNASTNTITIDPGVGNSISGSSTASINTNYGTLLIKYVSSGKWQIV